MARAEKDKKKRQKLDDLQLTSDEWSRVKTCLDLLAVSPSLFVCTHVTLTATDIDCSMRTMPSRHSHRTTGPPFILCCPLLKCFNVHGAHVQAGLSMLSSSPHWKPGAGRLRSTMRRPRRHKCTHSRSVSYCTFHCGMSPLISPHLDST